MLFLLIAGQHSDVMNKVLGDIIQEFPYRAISFPKGFMDLHKCGALHQRRSKIIANLASNIIRILVLLGVNFSNMPTHMIGNTNPKPIPTRSTDSTIQSVEFNMDDAVEVSSLISHIILFPKTCHIIL